MAEDEGEGEGEGEDDWERELVGTPVEKLITMFNGDVGNPGWVGARMRFLVKLRIAFLATGLDCSSFIDRGGMSCARRLKRVGNAIVPQDPVGEPRGGVPTHHRSPRRR